MKNGSRSDCVELKWEFPEPEKEATPIVGFRVMVRMIINLFIYFLLKFHLKVHRMGSGAMREWYVKGNKARGEQALCSLEAHGKL